MNLVLGVTASLPSDCQTRRYSTSAATRRQAAAFVGLYALVITATLRAKSAANNALVSLSDYLTSLPELAWCSCHHKGCLM